MKLLHAALILAADALHTSSASAAPIDCAPYVSSQRFPGKIPANFRLLPPCKNASPMGQGEAYWALIGHAKISGSLRYSGQDEYATVMLQADSSSRPLLPSDLRALQLDDRDGNRALKLPRLTNKQPCWIAPVTLEFDSISVISDGTDESGEFVRSYRILSVGPWNQFQGKYCGQ